MEYLADRDAPEHNDKSRQISAENLNLAFESEKELLIWLGRNVSPAAKKPIWERVRRCIDPRRESLNLLCEEVELWRWMFHSLYKTHYGRHFEDDYKSNVDGVVREGNIYDIRSLLAPRR